MLSRVNPFVLRVQVVATVVLVSGLSEGHGGEQQGVSATGATRPTWIKVISATNGRSRDEANLRSLDIAQGSDPHQF